jgi:cytoskeleton-associated protein 5
MQMEKNAAAGKTPSSLPLSTPPPIASIPSPKFAPSPVHTKAVDDRTDSTDDTSSETQSFRGQAEPDSRLHPTDQQTDRYQTSGPHHSCICAPTYYCVCQTIFVIFSSDFGLLFL